MSGESGPADPRTGQSRSGPAPATEEDIATAVTAAVSAGVEARNLSVHWWRDALRAGAAALEDARHELVEMADRETALGTERLVPEHSRMCGQLRMFADLVESGRHLDATLDLADPASAPPRPDIRRLGTPLGPVVVFEASNFPLAFGVAGNDTASALAAGCPVIVKAHPLHPTTSERVATILAEAIRAHGGPHALVSLIHGGPDVAKQLVEHPHVAAVGFTGSFGAGRALFDLASARPSPIPVFAEMGSLNPIIVLPRAAETRGTTIGTQIGSAVVLGAGQLCTKPGLVFVPASADDLTGALRNAVVSSHVRPLLGENLRSRYEEGVARASARSDGVQRGEQTGGDGFFVSPVVIEIETEQFVAESIWKEEIFGPATTVVGYRSIEALTAAIATIEGSLAGAVYADPDERVDSRSAVSALAARCGRVVYEGPTTGVAVTAAMEHGGPFPATTAPGTTSVGTSAVARFLRPVCFQSMPDDLLPPPLRDANPLGITRLVDGEWTSSAIARDP